MGDYFKLQMAPSWELANSTREFLLAMLTNTLGDAAMASQIALAAHELTENAIKYSRPKPDAKIRVEVVERNRSIAVTVENEARREDIATLITELTAVAEAKDPMAYYREKIEQAIARTDGRACLGLARIRFESQAQIKWTISGGRVRVTAVRRLDEAAERHTNPTKQPWYDG